MGSVRASEAVPAVRDRDVAPSIEDVGSTEGARRTLVGFALVLTALGVVAFVGLLLWAPAHFMGVDDAYYLGIGKDLFAGRGLVTAFGSFPSVHSPLWPIALQAPHAWFGLDPSRWGHVMVVIGGGMVIVLTAWFSWRSVRLAALLAAAAMIAFPFMLDLAEGMGLDLPAAALAMLYVALGIAAVRRGSLALGLAAGLTFAGAFLIKEIALPFAPVPLLAGLLRPASLAAIGRASAGILLAATVATSWWFVIYAQHLGVVYRLGTPAWTLVPLAIGAVVLAVVGLSVERIGRWAGRPIGRGGGRWATRLGWLGALAWAGILTVYFARTPNPFGAGFLVPAQAVANLSRYGPALWSVLVVGLVGGAIALVDRVRPALLRAPADEPAWSRGLLLPDERHAVDDLLLATLCGFPFVLLVISIGESPRHYIAHLGFLVALGAIGWSKLLVAVARRPSRLLLAATGVAIVASIVIAEPYFGARASRRLVLVIVAGAAVLLGLGALVLRARPLRRRPPPALAVGGLLTIVLAIALVVMVRAVPRTADPTDVTRAAAVATATAWAHEHLPPGTTVVFGSGLAMETALELVGDYHIAQVRDETGIRARPNAPLGLVALDGARPADWVALWTTRTDVTSFNGYRAGAVADAFGRIGPGVWIQTVATTDAAPSPILDVLGRTQGVEVLARWSWPYGSGRLETVAYRVDPAQLAFPGETVLTTGALERIVATMERAPAAYATAAADLLARVKVIPPDPRSAALLDRLRVIAAR